MTRQTPNIEDLARYALGDCTPEAAAEIGGVIAADAGVRRRLAEVVGLIESLRGQSVSAGLVGRLAAVFDAADGLAPSGFDGDVVRVLAELVSDSRDLDHAAGYRGQSTVYQLTFEAGGVEVHLQVKPSDHPGFVHVRGQVEVMDGDGAVTAVEFVPVGGGSSLRTVADRSGYFSADAELGVYDLRIRVADREIVIAAVELG